MSNFAFTLSMLFIIVTHNVYIRYYLILFVANVYIINFNDMGIEFWPTILSSILMFMSLSVSSGIVLRLYPMEEITKELLEMEK